MALYNLTYSKDMKVSLTDGNTKIGKVLNFSTLPGSEYLTTKTKGQLTDIKGTCSGVCEGCEHGGCYAVASATRHHNTCIPAWGKNTLILRNDIDGLFSQIKEECLKKKAKYLRYNVSGEIEDMNQLEHLVKLAEDCPDTTVYFYTKRFNLVNEYYNKMNKKFPDNLVCNISRWHNNDKDYNFEELGLNIFAYDDGTDENVSKMTHCPAVDKSGKETGITCDKCKRCMRNKGTKTAVYAH